VTRRDVDELANPKVQQIIVNLDKLEEELAPHAKGVDIVLAAFGVGKGSAKMRDEDVRKVEIAHSDRCIRCGACVVQCPTDALSFEGEKGSRIEPATIRRFKLNLLGQRKVEAGREALEIDGES